MKIAILLALVVVVGQLSLAVSSAQTEEFDAYRMNILDWMRESGVLRTETNRVVEGVTYIGGSWQLSGYGSAYRTDANGEMALAFLYQYQITGDVWFKSTALSLIEQLKADCVSTGRYPAMPTSTAASASIYTQDNGRAMKTLAKAVELTGDAAIRDFLTLMANWWTSKVQDDGSVGVGIDACRAGDHLTPPAGVCARATTELLIGFVRAYQACQEDGMKQTAIKLGEWLLENMEGGHLPCPSRYTDGEGGLKNGGVGNVVETNSLGLRALTLLWRITQNQQYRTAADSIYQWLKRQCDNTYSRWGQQVPSEVNRASDYSRFNTLYMFTPPALIDYYKLAGVPEALGYAKAILRFMCTTMTIHGSVTCEKGIVGEWDFAIGDRSTYADDEHMIWGNWIYTGWTNCEAVESLGKLVADDSGVLSPLSLDVSPGSRLFDQYSWWVGQTFDERIVIKNVTESGLTNASFILTYNATVISIAGGSDNVTIDPLWNTFNVVVNENPDAAVLDTVTISVSAPSSSPSGDTPVADIRFVIMTQAIAPPISPDYYDYSDLVFSSVFLYNGTREIPRGIWTNGRVTIYAFLDSPNVTVGSIIVSKTVVGQGCCLRVNITVADWWFTPETVNLTVYANATIIQTFTNITLPPYAQGTWIALTWNTTGFAKGIYAINATASPVPEETYTWDNSRVAGPVLVSIPGDTNADRKVDLIDVYAVGRAFGSDRNSTDGWYWHTPAWSCCPHSPNCDIDDDGKIDLKDYYTTCKNYGKSW